MAPASTMAYTEGDTQISKKKSKKGSKFDRKDRGKYPPARLIYRIQFDFEGSMSGRLNAADSTQDFSRDSEWRLRSTGAVRVSLMCTSPGVLDLDDPASDEPASFFHHKKVRRKKGRYRLKKVGGCRKGHTKRQMPTVRFGARARGDVTGWMLRWDNVKDGCGAWSEEQTLLQPQPIDGSISTGNSSLGGLRVSSAASTSGFNAATIDLFQESSECGGGSEGARPFAFTDHMGHEGWVDLKPVPDSLRFRVGPKQFGKRITRSFGPIEQDFDLFRGANPDGSSYWPYARKSYRYKLKMIPCPRKGRDFKNC